MAQQLFDSVRTMEGALCAWRCDLSDDSLSWTPGVFDLFGIPRGTPVARLDIVTMYCDESREELERLRSDAIANARSFTFEAEIVRTDGEHRWIRITADVACVDGRPVHLFGLKQDITAERAAQAERSGEYQRDRGAQRARQ